MIRRLKALLGLIVIHVYRKLGKHYWEWEMVQTLNAITRLPTKYELLSVETCRICGVTATVFTGGRRVYDPSQLIIPQLGSRPVESCTEELVRAILNS